MLRIDRKEKRRQREEGRTGGADCIVNLTSGILANVAVTHCLSLKQLRSRLFISGLMGRNMCYYIMWDACGFSVNPSGVTF